MPSVTLSASTRTRLLAVAPAAIALFLSIFLHTGVQWMGFGGVKKARSRTQVQLVFADPVDPIADEPEAQKPEPEAQKPEPKAQKPEPKAQKPEPKAQKPEPKAQKPEPKAQKPEPKKKKPEPKKKKPQQKKAVKNEKPAEKAHKKTVEKSREAKDLRPSTDERERVNEKTRKTRAQMQAEREKRAAAMRASADARKEKLQKLREARRLAARAAKTGQKRGGKKRGKGQKKGKGQKGGYEKLPPGDPEAVFACTATDKGRQVHMRAERALTDWVSLMPTVLMPFRTKPSLTEYLEGTGQVVQRYRSGLKRTGPVEFILPQEVLQLEVDSPANIRISVGRLDARCLVGVKYTNQIFPLELRRAPMRILNLKTHETHDALVTITLYKDASFDLKLTSDNAPALPFTRGKLKNGEAIARNIRDHYAAVDALKSVASFFGVDLVKISKEKRRKRMDQTAKEHRKKQKRVRATR